VTPLLILVLSLAAPFAQDGARERVKSAVATYVSPRTKVEERTRIVERLGAMGPASVGFIQAVADSSGPGGAFPPTRFLANEVKVDLLRRQGDERGAQAILRLRGLSGTIQAADLSLESVLDELRRQGLALMLVNPAEQDDLAFVLRGPIDPASSRFGLRFWRESPRIGLAGIAEIVACITAIRRLCI